MKKLILISAILVLSTTCFSQKKEWKKTKKLNTIEAYQDFNEKYPSSNYSVTAGIYIELLTEKLIESEFNKAQKINTIEGYIDFLSKYPVSQYSSEAKKEIERLNEQKADMELEKREKELVQEILSMGAENRFVIPEIKSIKSGAKKSLSIIQIKNEKVNEIRFISDLPNDIGTSTIYQEKFLSAGGISYSFFQTDFVTGKSSMNSSNSQKPPLPKLPMANGSIHRFKTTVYLDDIGLPESGVSKIEVLSNKPVAFVISDKGYIHLYGKGIVVFKNGESTLLMGE